MPRSPSSSPRPGAWGAAIALLARRDLSEGEVRSKLLRREYSEPEIERVVARLRERRHLDDRRLARSLAAAKRQGPNKVFAHLRRRQIPEEVVREAIREEFAEGVEIARAATTLARLKRTVRTTPTDREERRREQQRLFRGLVARGYSFEVARHALAASQEQPP